jgi:hypothetical protein
LAAEVDDPAGLALVMSVHLAEAYWVLITIAVVLRPYAAMTLQRAVLRTGRTMLGRSSAPASCWGWTTRRA